MISGVCFVCDISPRTNLQSSLQAGKKMKMYSFLGRTSFDLILHLSLKDMKSSVNSLEIVESNELQPVLAGSVFPVFLLTRGQYFIPKHKTSIKK